MKIKINVYSKKSQHRKEFAEVKLNSTAFSEDYFLDLNFFPFLQFFKTYSPTALSFLYMSSIIYVVDKIVPRSDFEDNWTRDIDLEIPIPDFELWNEQKDEFENIMSFLSGDNWKFNFSPLKSKLYRRTRKRKVKPDYSEELPFDGVSLFSGGLDSLIGAIDCAESNPNKKVLLVSHHDGNISGPESVQLKLRNSLKEHYSDGIWHLHSRISQSPLENKDHNYRSRSILYIAMGIFAANSICADTPLIIPENGSISLNYPLSASRIGSSSTRTAHPYYLESLNNFLPKLGIHNKILNPLKFKTKGEAVKECLGIDVLRKTARMSVSCAKGRRAARYWQNPRSKACGQCMPCIFRRAALNTIGLDNPKDYGNQLQDIDISSSKVSSFDLRALVSLIKKNLSKDYIESVLLSTCKIDYPNLENYSDLVLRTLKEVKALLKKSKVL